MNGNLRNWTDEALPSGLVFSRVGSGSPRIRSPADLEKNVVLDPAQARQHRGPARRVVDLEHDRGDQLLSLRDQRIVGGQLVLDLRIAALLDMQHLLHLVPHRLVILEVEGREGPDLQPTAPFDLGDPLALIAADRGVFGERQNILTGQPALVAELMSLS